MATALFANAQQAEDVSPSQPDSQFQVAGNSQPQPNVLSQPQAGGGAQLPTGTVLRTWNFWERYQARVTKTQNEQPHWITPLVTVTPRLEQELRTDFVHETLNTTKGLWNYGNGKRLEFIPQRHVEILINVPPFFNRSNGESDGFGDMNFNSKYRFFARNEEHGNAIVTGFFAASIPTGKNGNGSCCAVVTSTLAVGKGWGQLALTSTAGGSLPVSNTKGWAGTSPGTMLFNTGRRRVG